MAGGLDDANTFLLSSRRGVLGTGRVGVRGMGDVGCVGDGGKVG